MPETGGGTRFQEMTDEGTFRQAIERSWVVRSPKQQLATFGLTNIEYYVVTEPIYQQLNSSRQQEGVVRTGRVISERPAVVTPTYALNLQGFSSDAYEYFKEIASKYGPNSPGILYQYKKEPAKTDILSGDPAEIAHRIGDDLDRRKENMTVVMVGGLDELWDVALLKFIYEFTSLSVAGNVQEFRARGLLDSQQHLGGVPSAASQRIEQLFREVDLGGSADTLKEELDRWGLFEYYEDRFLNIFRRKR